jgi:hypothetical protein
MLRYRDHGYDDDWVRAKAEFLVVDPAFNALWAWSELALAEIARRLGRDEAAPGGSRADHRSNGGSVMERGSRAISGAGRAVRSAAA